MPNVFDGIEKMKEDQLKSQLATLKVVTMSNVYGEMGQKVSQTAVKAFNFARGLFKAPPVEEPKVVPLNERISECADSMRNMSKDALVSETKKVLLERLGSSSGSIGDGPSDDAISVRVIDEARNAFKDINKDLSPSQKADAIFYRYNERLISQASKKFSEASEAEKREIAGQLQKDINEMSAEERRELQKALHVEELTAETLTSVLTTSAGASALLIALNASGFGAFVALTTIMHAVFTTTLHITLPFAAYATSTSALSFLIGPAGWIIFIGAEIFMFNSSNKKMVYELMAQVVWASVVAYGGSFTPKDEALPSWLPKEQRQKAQADNSEYMALLKEFNELKAKSDSQEAKIRKNETDRRDKEAQIRSLRDMVSNQNGKIEQLRSEKIRLDNEIERSKKEAQQYKQYINSENQELRQKYKDADYKIKKLTGESERKQREIDRLNKSNEANEELINMSYVDLDKAKKENEELLAENAGLKKTIEEFQPKVEKKETKEYKKLQERWTSAYKKFEFEQGVIKYVTKNYEFNEYGDIEGRLMELHEAKDPAALCSNRGKMAVSGDLHIEVSTRTGFPSRIFYKPLKNVAGKTIRITNIVKHNDSRYGKR